MDCPGCRIRAVTNEALTEGPPPNVKVARQRRSAFMVFGAAVAVVAIIFFAVVLLRPGNSLTHREYGLARDLVRQEIRKENAVLTSATVTVGKGKVMDSNLGYSCTSGRLLHIKLIGNFPHITTTGHPVQPGTTLPDFTVHAIVLTADAKTGRACLMGVQTGDVAPVPGAVSLPIN